MDKKNIDQLFQEKFDNFSEVPDERVWENIKSSLDKKKRTPNRIPLWWKLGGIAALFMAGMLIFNSLEDPSDNNQKTTGIPKEGAVKRANTLENTNSPIIESDSQEAVTSTASESNTSEHGKAANSLVTKEASANLGSRTSSSADSFQKKNDEVKVVANQATIRPKNENQDDSAESKEPEIANNLNTSVIAGNEGPQNGNESFKNKREEIPNPEERQPVNDEGNGIVLTEEKTFTKTKEAPKKISIFDVIEPNEEDAIVSDEADHKWSVGGTIAPVYFNAIGEGSPIHSSFAPNAKSGEINLSYGLSVGYEISKKLKIRSGINKVDFGYDTNDVEFSSSFTASANEQIPNIDYKVASENVFVASKSSANALKNDFAFDASAIDASRDGVMTQRFGYLEIPLELNYALIERRFGVDVIGGLSSLFLVDNSVALTSGNLTTEIGTANNLNTVNFSTNIGFGFNYKFSPKVQFNVEPVFKYQLNTFSNTAGSFQPFSMGIYSGLNFSF